MVRSSLRVSAAAAPRRQRSEWSVDQCARFAALKEYHLIRALTNDLRTLAEARKVGLLPEAPHQGAEGDKEEGARRLRHTEWGDAQATPQEKTSQGGARGQGAAAGRGDGG